MEPPDSFPVLQVFDMSNSFRTFEVNGRLWSARASDWANYQEQVHQPIYRAVLRAADVEAGTRFLDVGCGSGLAVGLAAAGGAEVTGLDAAEDLLKIASSRTPSADFHLGDLETLPFDDCTFDVVSGINSFQYAGNPIVALSEARRVMRSNGKLVIVTWGMPEQMDAAELVSAIKSLMPPPKTGTPGPFALSDENALRSFVREANLEPIELFDIDCPFEYTDLEVAVRGMSSTGVAAKAMELAGETAVEEAYKSALSKFLQPDGSIRVGASFRCIVTKKLGAVT